MAYREPIPSTKLKLYRWELEPIKRAFDLLKDHVVITDENGNILYANKAVEEKTGFSIEEAIGKNPADLWGGKMAQDFYEKMWHTIKTEKKPFVGEVRNVKKDGKEYWQELHISPILDASGEVKFFIAIEPDITDRKKKEQFRDEFIAMIGHQLKNPIAALRWTLDLLSHKGGMNATQREEVETLYHQSKNLNDLIGDLLVLSRIENLELKNERVDFGREAEEAIKAVKRQYPDTVFSFQKNQENFPIESSRILVSQVCMNIILNAAGYSDKTSRKVDIILKNEGDAYIFSCSDNGIGIPEKDQSHLFSRFFRGSNAREMRKEGTGLGLFIVKMIIDELGWKISFESKVGKGTTFLVRIPYAI